MGRSIGKQKRVELLLGGSILESVASERPKERGRDAIATNPELNLVRSNLLHQKISPSTATREY